MMTSGVKAFIKAFINRKTVLNLFTLTLLSLYFLLFCQYGFNLWDEGALLNGGLRVLDGDMPIRDFNGYPPGRYFIASLLFFFFGEEILPLRAAISVLTAVSVMFLYHSARQIMPCRFALLSSVLFMAAPSVYYNRFFPIFLIIGIYFILKMVDGIGWRRSVWLLLATLFSLVFKFEVAVIVYIAGVTVLIMTNRKGDRAGPFVSGSLFVVAAGLYGGPGYFEDFYKLLFQSYQDWGTPFPVPDFHISITDLLLKRGFFDALLFYYPPTVYAISASFLIFLVIRHRGRLATRDFKILAVLLVGVLSYGLVIWRSGFDNLIRVLPPSAILSGFLLSVWRRKSKSSLTSIVFILLTLFPGWYIYQMVWNHGFYVGSIGAVKEGGTLLPFDRAKVYTNETEYDWAVEVVDFLEQNTDKNDSVFAIPLNSVWNFLTDRKNPTSFEWIVPSTMRKPHVEQDVIRELMETSPRLIVLSDIAIDNREERRFSNYAREIFVYILENYRVIKQAGIFTIFEKKQGENTA